MGAISAVFENCILTNNRVAALLANVINTDQQSPMVQPKEPTGMLRLAFSHSMSSNTPNVWAQVQPLPEDQTEKDGPHLPISALKDGTFLTVNALESGQVFGPFASGRYMVRLIVGGSLKPIEQEVTVDSEHTAELEFQLIP